MTLKANMIGAASLALGFVLVAETPGSTGSRSAYAARPMTSVALFAHQAAPPQLVESLATDGSHTPASEALTEVVQRYCVGCHNDRSRTGNLSLEAFAVERAAQEPEIAEKMILKLRASMMPPPGRRRPGGDTLVVLTETLEAEMDAAFAASPNPGARTFQRLNRTEYERSIQELLGLEVDAAEYLPPDTRSAGFDNIADVQMVSPTLLNAYLTAAREISTMAFGQPDALPEEVIYPRLRRESQWDRVDGAPVGTRGGITVNHHFPADADYRIKLWFQESVVGGVSGGTARGEMIEISVDGVRKALLRADPFRSASDPKGMMMEAPEPIFVTAGPHRVTAAFLKQFDGPVEDVLSPFDWSGVDPVIGGGAYGITALPHLSQLAVTGPYDVQGVTETPTRRRVLSCRPASPAEERPCAEENVSRLARTAYRRPVSERDVEGLMRFYEEGAEDGGFEEGMRMALQAILASPQFTFRLERPAGEVRPGEAYRISDDALASRLSFFIWGTPPDDELVRVAERGELSRPEVLEAQALRLLQDSRSAALGTRFASQWLRLQDMGLVQPLSFWYPDYDQQLADALRRETELFFNHVVREDESFFELLTADYTFVNERLARHYGIQGVAGDHFRRVEYPDENRRGLLGHGSIHVLTSMANRTSPVVRGKWVMEVILGIEPPPPPPNIPDLEETAAVTMDGQILTTRRRLEVHRNNPTCNACHQFMDPLGLALDNFDVVGRWRGREVGWDGAVELDTRGVMWDGTPVSSALELQQTLLSKYPIVLVRAFTEYMLSYALGRRIESYDQPTVRAIAKQVETDDYRMSSFVLNVVKSQAFQEQGPELASTETH